MRSLTDIQINLLPIELFCQSPYGMSISMNAKIPTCVICSKPLTPDAAVTDDHGLPVHKKCYALIVKVKGVKVDGTRAVRCPYCVEDQKFKLMKAQADGELFLCPGCGHAAMPGQPSYRCNCSKCVVLT